MSLGAGAEVTFGVAGAAGTGALFDFPLCALAFAGLACDVAPMEPETLFPLASGCDCCDEI